MKVFFYILICSLSVVSFTSCSYSSWHQGFKEQQTQKCYDAEGLIQTECLDSLDYSIEEYEEERNKQLGKDKENY